MDVCFWNLLKTKGDQVLVKGKTIVWQKSTVTFREKGVFDKSQLWRKIFSQQSTLEFLITIKQPILVTNKDLSGGQLQRKFWNSSELWNIFQDFIKWQLECDPKDIQQLTCGLIKVNFGGNGKSWKGKLSIWQKSTLVPNSTNKVNYGFKYFWNILSNDSFTFYQDLITLQESVNKQVDCNRK